MPDEKAPIETTTPTPVADDDAYDPSTIIPIKSSKEFPTLHDDPTFFGAGSMHKKPSSEQPVIKPETPPVADDDDGPFDASNIKVTKVEDVPADVRERLKKYDH